jgi:hypothetical protein
VLRERGAGRRTGPRQLGEQTEPVADCDLRAHFDGDKIAEHLERERVNGVHFEGGSWISHEDLQWLASAARHTAPYSTCSVRQLFLSAIR